MSSNTENKNGVVSLDDFRKLHQFEANKKKTTTEVKSAVVDLNDGDTVANAVAKLRPVLDSKIRSILYGFADQIFESNAPGHIREFDRSSGNWDLWRFKAGRGGNVNSLLRESININSQNVSEVERWVYLKDNTLRYKKYRIIRNDTGTVQEKEVLSDLSGRLAIPQLKRMVNIFPSATNFFAYEGKK